MTKEEEFVVKVFQKCNILHPIGPVAKKAIETNNEVRFINNLLAAMEEYESLKDWYIHMLGEDLYNELQKFKTEKE